MPQRGASRLGRSRWMTEFELIRRFRQITASLRSSVIAGIGDDAAVLKIQSDHVLLATTDLLAEEVHFDLDYMTYRQVGYRAGVANLSDIAAMGGTPRYALIAVALSPGTTAAAAVALYSGIQAACRRTGTAIVGEIPRPPGTACCYASRYWEKPNRRSCCGDPAPVRAIVFM